MIGKVITFPFWLVSKIIGTAFGIVKMAVLLVVNVFRFALSHVLGTVFGALIGLLLGRRHVGVRLFTRKKRPRKPARSHS